MFLIRCICYWKCVYYATLTSYPGPMQEPQLALEVDSTAPIWVSVHTTSHRLESMTASVVRVFILHHSGGKSTTFLRGNFSNFTESFQVRQQISNILALALFTLTIRVALL